MSGKKTTLINKITKNDKFEINTKIKKAINLEQAGFDGIRFRLGNQKLWLKRNFSKITKTMISGPKRWNSVKN